MELGIDVGQVDHVIQYKSPRQVTRLLQRIGRAGHRQDEVSNGTIVTTRPDDTFEALSIARRARDGEVEPAAIHEGSLDVVANQLPAIVQSRGDTYVDDAVETVTRSYPFRTVPAETIREIIPNSTGIEFSGSTRPRIASRPPAAPGSTSTPISR